MSDTGCLAGRDVLMRFKHRKTGKIHDVTVVCPSNWSRARLLKYCRREHPNETVVILAWPMRPGWDPRLWIVNPKEMVND